MSSFWLHASPEVLEPLGKSIVDDPELPTVPHTPDFIPLTLWPPNSPDLNPADYKMWSVMQEQVYHTPIHDVDDLRQRLLNVWASVDQRFIYYFVRRTQFWQIKFKNLYL